MKANSPRILTVLFLLAMAISVLAASFGTTADAEKQPPAKSLPTVLDFGAVGDGVADDTAAIQAAIDAGTGDIHFPAGIYRLTKTLEVDLSRAGPIAVVGHGTARLVMEGSGPALRIVGTRSKNADPSNSPLEVWQRERAPMIDGIEIYGAHPEACGIQLRGTIQATITRVVVRQALDGIHITGLNRNVIISDCHLYDNRGVGVFLDRLNLHQINIVGSHISYNRGGGIVVRQSEIRNLQIGTCDIEGNMNPTGPPTANVLFDTAEGSIREGAIVGCTIQHDHRAPDSANIRFLGRGADNPLKIGHFLIAHNALSDVQVNVHLRHVRGVVLSGNTFWSGFAHHVLVEGCQGVVLASNLMDRNPDYNSPDDVSDVVFKDSRECAIQGLTINGAASKTGAVVLSNCRWCQVSDSTFFDNDAAGLVLDHCEYCRVNDCRGRDTRAQVPDPLAVRVAGGRENSLVDCQWLGRVEIDPQAVATGK